MIFERVGSGLALTTTIEGRRSCRPPFLSEVSPASPHERRALFLRTYKSVTFLPKSGHRVMRLLPLLVQG
jgi:hypothetical protein